MFCSDGCEVESHPAGAPAGLKTSCKESDAKVGGTGRIKRPTACPFGWMFQIKRHELVEIPAGIFIGQLGEGHHGGALGIARGPAEPFGIQQAAAKGKRLLSEQLLMIKGSSLFKLAGIGILQDLRENHPYKTRSSGGTSKIK